jgi:hypothetical protein
VIGTEGRLEERLQRSEDSSTLNTSFIELLNLNDPARFRISLPEDDMSCPLEATSGRTSGITPVLLQFRQTTSGAQIRVGNSDTGHAGWTDQKAADAAEDLLFGGSLSRMVQDRARVRLPRKSSLW